MRETKLHNPPMTSEGVDWFHIEYIAPEKKKKQQHSMQATTKPHAIISQKDTLDQKHAVNIVTF